MLLAKRLSPNTPLSFPAETLTEEITRLLSISPDFVADSSRNYVRLYVPDLQVAVTQLVERL